MADRLREAGLRLVWVEPPRRGVDYSECPACGDQTDHALGWEVVVANGARVCDACLKRHVPELYLARKLAIEVRLHLCVEDGCAPTKSDFTRAIALTVADIVRAGDAIARDFPDPPPF